MRLLHMTVLPYVMVSLIAGIGGLDPSSARRLLTKVGIVLLSLWALALLDTPEPFDFLGLYIPSNPFNSLANNVVPAVVFFSGLVDSR